MQFFLPRLVACICLATLVGGGLPDSPACHAEEMQYPLSITVAENGQMFVADRNLPGIWKIADGKRSVFFRGQKRFRTPLNAVRCVRVDRQGNLLAGDSATRNIYRFDADGKPQPVTKATKGMGLIGIPMDIGVNSKGDIYVTDLEIHRVVKIAAGKDEPEEIAEIAGCRGLFVDKNDAVWVISTTEDQLHRIAPDGKQTVVVPGRPFQFPHTVAVSDDGTAFVCDGYAKTVWKVAGDGKPEPWAAGEPFVGPVGLAIRDGALFVADPRATAVFSIDQEGTVTKVDAQADE